MDACQRPHVEFPCRVPLKIIGREGELRPELIAALVLQHLGLQPEGDRTPTANRRGAYISFTFWVTLEDERSELPLREAIQKLPGYVMQL